MLPKDKVTHCVQRDMVD